MALQGTCMLESFYVSNFRLFQQLEVKKLNRVNLIVGQNNAGKSTFLEALELYVSNASATVLLDLVDYRQETWLSEAQPESQNFLGNSVRHLFFGHKLPQIGEKGIVIGEGSSKLVRLVKSHNAASLRLGMLSVATICHLDLKLDSCLYGGR